MRASNSLGPMWCAPHIEGQYLRDEITKIAVRDTMDWFKGVYELLEKHEIPKEWRAQFYAYAISVENRRHSVLV